MVVPESDRKGAWISAANSDDLHVGNLSDFAENIIKFLIGKTKRISAGNNDISNGFCLFYIIKSLLQLFFSYGMISIKRVAILSLPNRKRAGVTACPKGVKL